MISPYDRENVIAHKVVVDFYDVVRLLEANGKTIPHEIVHALKKLCYVNGGRGHKNLIQDLKESVWSINKYIEFLEYIDYNPEDLPEEKLEELIESSTTGMSTMDVMFDEYQEGRVEITEEIPFDLDLAVENSYCFTRAGEKMRLGELVNNTYWDYRSLYEFDSLRERCKVDASDLREYHSDSPNDVLYNELPEDFKEGK